MPHNIIIHNNKMGILLVIVASFLLAGMNGAVKALTLLGYPTLQITFVNGVIGFCFVTGWLAWRGRLGRMRTRNPMLALFVATAICACFSLFYAFGHGQLAEISTIVAASPLGVAALSYFFLRGERLTRWQAALIVAGFTGVILVLQPGAGSGWRDADAQLALAAAVCGTFFLACSQVLVRRLSGAIDTFAFTFYFYIGLMLVAGLLMPAQPVALEHAPLFLLSGLCDVTSLLMMYTAFRIAPVSLVAPFQYTNILWSAAIGFIFWQAVPAGWTFAGAAVIIVAGVAFVRSALARKVIAA